MTQQSITVYTCDSPGCLSSIQKPREPEKNPPAEWWAFTIAITDEAGTISKTGHACGRPHLRDALDDAIEDLEES